MLSTNRLAKNIPQDLLDMTVCPDCYREQTEPKAAGDVCENVDECESEVYECKTRDGKTVLVWQNPNWGE